MINRTANAHGAAPRLAAELAPRTDPEAGPQFRIGGQVLSLFSTALHGLILRALADGPMRLTDLRRRAGSPAQTTLRGNMGNLIGIGALERRGRDGAPNTVDNELTPIGMELLGVADSLEGWLSRAPSGPIPFESEAAKGAIKALIGGWNSTMLRALAVRSFSLTEIDTLISSYSYPSLERRLGMMHLSGQVTAIRGNGSTPYSITDWLREGVGPLLTAARCERVYLANETSPLTRLDAETIFLLAVPLIDELEDLSGSCQLAISSRDESKRGPAGVHIAVERGRIVSCVSKLQTRPANWAFGSASAWLNALVEDRAERLDIGGDHDLAPALVSALHKAVFASALSQAV